MDAVQRLVITAVALAVMCLCSACSTGADFHFGWTPVTAIDHHEQFSSKAMK